MTVKAIVVAMGREKVWVAGILAALVLLAGAVLARRATGISNPPGPSASDPSRVARPFHAAAPLVAAQSYPADAPALRIAEVYLGQPTATTPKAQVWAELYCARGPIDLAQYVLTDLDGTDGPIASVSTVLQTGEYAVVRWDEGISEEGTSGDRNGNGVRDLYLGGRRGRSGPIDDVPSVNIDQIVIHRVNSDVYFEDAVAWTIPGQEPERWEADDMIAIAERGGWRGPALEATHIEGASWVVRDISARERGASSWVLAAVATPGLATEGANIPTLGSVRLTEVHPMATRKEAFAEIRASKETNLRAFILTDLSGASSPLAEGDLTLKAGEYAVIHWRDGITEVDARGDQNGNGYRDIYLSANEAPARTEDVLILALGGQIYDAVSWKEKGGTPTEAHARKLAGLAARGANLTPFELTGPATLLARLGESWGVTSITTPGATTRQAPAPPARGTVVVSEVFPAGAGSWAEIEVRGRTAVDVSLFVVTDLDGRGEALARDPVTLQPGERVVVRWGAGTDEVDGQEDANGNGIREVYLSTEPPSSTTDQLAIYFGSTLYDAIAWTNKDERITQAEAADIAQLRREGVNVRPIVRDPLASVARVGSAVASHADPTPGLPNEIYISRPFGGIKIVAFKVSSGGSWVEVEATTGPTDISRLIVSDLDAQDREPPLSEEPILLQPGARARIRWGRGDNDLVSAVKTIHIDQEPPTKSADQIVLIHHGRILDAVVFADWNGATFPHPERDDVKRLVEANQWRARDFARPDAIATDGASMRRNASGAWEKING